MGKHINEVKRLLHLKGFSVINKDNNSILLSLPLSQDSSHLGQTKEIKFFCNKHSRLLGFGLDADISIVYDQKSDYDLAEVLARFTLNYNPNRFRFSFKEGRLIIMQIRKMGILQKSISTTSLFIEFITQSKQALQWIMFHSNNSLYNDLWPNTTPKSQFHIMENDL